MWTPAQIYAVPVLWHVQDLEAELVAVKKELTDTKAHMADMVTAASAEKMADGMKNDLNNYQLKIKV